MDSLREVENAVRQFFPEELAAFRARFARFDAEVWDRQFKEDAAAGRLDQLADEAIQDLRTGRYKDL